MIDQYLERLFTWESLENTERGVEFELKNRLVEAEFEGITAIELDREAVPANRITLELPGGDRYAADEITPENPLELDLAETVQFVLDTERLRLGVHELSVELSVDGFGEVGFTTDDEITEADLVDVDPGELTVDELRDLAGAIREPRTFERLLERERNGKDRKTAIELLETHLDQAEPLTEDAMLRTEPSENKSGGSLVEELLVEVLQSPQRVSVYLAVQALGSGTPGEVAGRTVFPESVVRSTLEDLESQGIATRDEDDHYSVVGPVRVLQKRQQDLWNVLGRAL